MNYKIGDKSKFSFAMGKAVSNIQNVDFEYTIKSIIGVCPNCGEKLGTSTIVRIVKLLSIDDAKHYIGYSRNGHTLKLEKEDIPKEHLK